MKLFLALLLVNYALLVSMQDLESEDLYQILGIKRDATVKEIRQAYKKLAVKLHPDKNKDDTEATDKFMKITEAYDVLKEPESRKSYDIYGDKGTPKGYKPTYHSYSYYTEQFGIYDDDPLVVTLSKADYELNVVDQSQAWFINFYSPNCHHCHELAPTWRKLAVELEGIIRIAAVNCEEDWILCHQLSINAYPTLLYYEKEAHMYEGEQYRDARQFSDLKDFVLSRLGVSTEEITKNSWDAVRTKRWLLFLCVDGSAECPEEETMLKVTATLEGLASVGMVRDLELCDEIYESHRDSPIVFWNVNEKTEDIPRPQTISGSDSKEIVNNVLDLLPNPVQLDDENFKNIRSELRKSTEKPWLICFYMGSATELNLQLKRLPTLVTSVNIGLIHCGKSSALCQSLHVSHYPAWGVLKEGGAFELHHGRDVLYEVAAFARDSVKSKNLHALSPADYTNILNEGDTWFIDWYAPWCPPCRKLMPEMRKASQHFQPEQVQFGSIDCTLHSKLCAQEGVKSYPTTVFYSDGKSSHYHGALNEAGIIEFVEDMLNPSVINLDSNSFAQLLRKPKEEMWMVDFFAPWCGPCQRLSPQWRTFAKQMKQFPNVKIAHVDCVANSDLCNAQNVKSYPTIRMYPLESKGLNTVIMYNGHRDAVALKNWVLDFLPSPVMSLTAEDFKSKIIDKTPLIPWLVDFYAPWCGHCVNFEPDFRLTASKLEGIARAGKLNCENERHFCGSLRVNSYPTVILYLSYNNYYEISTQVPDEIVRQVKDLIKSKRKYVHDEF